MEPPEASKQIQPLSVHTKKRKRGKGEKEGQDKEMMAKKEKNKRKLRMFKRNKAKSNEADRIDVTSTHSKRKGERQLPSLLSSLQQ